MTRHMIGEGLTCLLNGSLTTSFCFGSPCSPSVVKGGVGAANNAKVIVLYGCYSRRETVRVAEQDRPGVVDASWIEADDVEMLRMSDSSILNFGIRWEEKK